MKKVGLTGALSSGKSTVCQIFQELGAFIVNADEIVHQLLSLKTPLGQKIVHLLGQDVVINEVFNRKAIAEKVFHNPKLLKNLEMLIHPEVYVEIKKQYYAVVKKNNYSLFIAEIPLLFETMTLDFKQWLDSTIALVTSYKRCSQFYKDNKPNQKDYALRMSYQFSSSQKAKKANFIIYNNGSLNNLKSQVISIFKRVSYKPQESFPE